MADSWFSLLAAKTGLKHSKWLLLRLVALPTFLKKTSGGMDSIRHLQSTLAEKLTFKGGTSLSKVYKIIDRFSEDIDLTYDIREVVLALAYLHSQQ
jgi:hypothetical protein